MKIVNIDEEIFISLNNLRNFNEIFRKEKTYDNINSHKKPTVSPCLWKTNFWKNHRKGGGGGGGGGGQIYLPLDF